MTNPDTLPKLQPTVRDGWHQVLDYPSGQRYTKKLIRGSKDSTRYLEELISMSCAPDMLALRLFPNGKEITESFGCYRAVRDKLQDYNPKDPNVTLVAVGDGRTPRTSATFAFRSAWTCHSVDPILKGGILRWASIKRLKLHPQKVEDVKIEAPRVIIVAVHSHARLEQAIKSIKANDLSVVAIPCCVPQILDRPPDLEYQDQWINSPCRTVKIWKHYR